MMDENQDKNHMFCLSWNLMMVLNPELLEKKHVAVKVVLFLKTFKEINSSTLIFLSRARCEEAYSRSYSRFD